MMTQSVGVPLRAKWRGPISRNRNGSLSESEWATPDWSFSGATTVTSSESSPAIDSSSLSPCAWMPSSLVSRIRMARLFAWPVRRGEGVLARRDDPRRKNRAWNWAENPSLDPKREISYLFTMGSGSSSSDHGSTSTIKLAATSRSGPFATGTVTLKPAKALVRNGTDGPLVVVSAVVCPLVDEQNGLPVGIGRLAAGAAPASSRQEAAPRRVSAALRRRVRAAIGRTL